MSFLALSCVVLPFAIGVTQAEGASEDPARGPAGPQRPNIVVVMVDDLGWRDTSPAVWTGPAGDSAAHFQTPFLERLAREGTRFSEGYASAPVCTPSRTSFMTGMSPARSGITYWTKEVDRDTSAGHPLLAAPKWRVNALQPGDVTLAGILSSAGYRTIHLGKAHFGTGVGGDPTKLGFDVNVAGWAGGGPGSYYGIDDFSADGRARRAGRKGGNRSWDVPDLSAYHGKEIFLTDALAIEAERELRAAAAAERPFFLHFAPYAVHAPLMVNPRVADRFPGLEGPELAYATLVASADDALGRLLGTIDEVGLADNTIVLYMGDNGGLSAHGRGGPKHTHNLPLRSGKGSAYEGGIRVPMIVRWPGVSKAGAVVAGPVVTHDWFTTLAEAAQAPVPAPHATRVEGLDLLPAIAGREPVPERPIVFHQPHYWGVAGPGIEPFSALRFGDHKLIYFHSGANVDPETGKRSGGPRFELYRVQDDLGETRDLASSKPLRLAAMAEMLSVELEAARAGMSIVKATGEPVDLPRASLRPLAAKNR